MRKTSPLILAGLAAALSLAAAPAMAAPGDPITQCAGHSTCGP